MADAKQGNGKVGKAQEAALARRELKGALSRAGTAKQRLDLLISHPQGEAIIPTLPAEDLYFTVKETGLSDAVDLVRLVSPQQFRTFVDLDAWKRDRAEPLTALAWLRAAGTDEDEERFRKKIHALDVEMLELILRTTSRVWDLEEDPDPEPQGISFRSPEGRYLVEFTVDGADYMGAKRLLDELYAEDPFQTARLLEAVRWEVPTELEETAFRWRSGRLQDLGFPELSEALSYFAWLDPDAALPTLDKAPAVPDSFFLARFEPEGSFFDRAAATVPDADRAILERQLVIVLNAVMVVEGIDPGDVDQVQLALRAAKDTLSLGLEHAAKADLAAAGALLVAAPLKRVFQVGVSLALRLKYRADRLMKSGKASLPGSKDDPLFDRPLAEVLVALRRKRPQYAAALDSPTASEASLRPFRDRRDLDRVARALEEAERLAEVFAALGFDPRAAAESAGLTRPVDLLPFLKFSDFFLTALARERVGEGFAFEPLPAGKLAALADAAFATEEGEASVKPELVALAQGKLQAAAGPLSEGHARAAESFGALALQRLAEDVGTPWLLGTLGPDAPLPLLIKR